jgi:crossover junction endodeoxyribonuclease RusA
MEAREAMPQASLRVHMAFCAPDRIRRDMDNMIAAMKAGLDGISDAIGVDDHLWVLTVERGPIMKPGIVRVTITVAP